MIGYHKGLSQQAEAERRRWEHWETVGIPANPPTSQGPDDDAYDIRLSASPWWAQSA